MAVLARVEAKRFARHPLFVDGFAICCFMAVSTANNAKSDIHGGDGFVPSLFVGVASMVVSYGLTRSTRRPEEALNAVPTAATTRTAALCLACRLPAAVGVIWLAVMLFAVRWWPRLPWGSAARRGRRWLVPIPSGAVLMLIAVVGSVTAGLAVAINSSGGLLPTAVRLGAVHVLTDPGRGNRSVGSWTGSPWWYLTRTPPLRLGARCLAAGLLSYGLAVTGGLSRVVTSCSSDTHSTPAAR